LAGGSISGAEREVALVAVMPLADVPPNGCKAVMVDDVDVLIVQTAAGLFAVENMCSHAYSKLEDGRARGVHIFCPLHGIRFDLRDGKPSGKLTDKPIEAFHVEIADDQVLVDLTKRHDAG
jgi:3-phenylpropionate/trans-cinnamate dioxygenase ferredoxin component